MTTTTKPDQGLIFAKCACGAELRYSRTELRRKNWQTRLRARAAAEGWTKTPDGRYLCPDHAA